MEISRDAPLKAELHLIPGSRDSPPECAWSSPHKHLNLGGAPRWGGGVRFLGIRERNAIKSSHCSAWARAVRHRLTPRREVSPRPRGVLASRRPGSVAGHRDSPRHGAPSSAGRCHLVAEVIPLRAPAAEARLQKERKGVVLRGKRKREVHSQHMPLYVSCCLL